MRRRGRCAPRLRAAAVPRPRNEPRRRERAPKQHVEPCPKPRRHLGQRAVDYVGPAMMRGIGMPARNLLRFSQPQADARENGSRHLVGTLAAPGARNVIPSATPRWAALEKRLNVAAPDQNSAADLHGLQVAAANRLQVGALAERRGVLIDPLARARHAAEDGSEVFVQSAEERPSGEFAPSRRREPLSLRRASRRSTLRESSPTAPGTTGCPRRRTTCPLRLLMRYPLDVARPTSIGHGAARDGGALRDDSPEVNGLLRPGGMLTRCGARRTASHAHSTIAPENPGN